MPEAKWRKIEATSGFGRAIGPFVTLSLDGDDIVQMSVEEARHHAMCVLQAAEAAETDGMIVQFMANVLGERPDRVNNVAVLAEFRKIRDIARRSREGVV